MGPAASQSSVLAQFLLSLQGEILRHAGASGCQSWLQLSWGSLPLRADPEHLAGPESQVLVFCMSCPCVLRDGQEQEQKL